MKTQSLCSVLCLSALALFSSLFAGCSQYAAWDTTHERTYAVNYDADAKTGALSMTIRPAANANSLAPVPASAISDETIAKIVQIVYAAAKKNEPLTTPELK